MPRDILDDLLVEAGLAPEVTPPKPAEPDDLDQLLALADHVDIAPEVPSGVEVSRPFTDEDWTGTREAALQDAKGRGIIPYLGALTGIQNVTSGIKAGVESAGSGLAGAGELVGIPGMTEERQRLQDAVSQTIGQSSRESGNSVLGRIPLNVAKTVTEMAVLSPLGRGVAGVGGALGAGTKLQNILQATGALAPVVGAQAATQAEESGLTGGDKAGYVASQIAAEAVPTAIMAWVGLPGLEAMFRPGAGQFLKGAIRQQLATAARLGVEEIPEELASDLAGRFVDRGFLPEQENVPIGSIISDFLANAPETAATAFLAPGAAVAAGSVLGRSQPQPEYAGTLAQQAAAALAKQQALEEYRAGLPQPNTETRTDLAPVGIDPGTTVARGPNGELIDVGMERFQPAAPGPVQPIAQGPGGIQLSPEDIAAITGRGTANLPPLDQGATETTQAPVRPGEAPVDAGTATAIQVQEQAQQIQQLSDMFNKLIAGEGNISQEPPQGEIMAPSAPQPVAQAQREAFTGREQLPGNKGLQDLLAQVQRVLTPEQAETPTPAAGSPIIQPEGAANAEESSGRLQGDLKEGAPAVQETQEQARGPGPAGSGGNQQVAPDILASRWESMTPDERIAIADKAGYGRAADKFGEYRWDEMGGNAQRQMAEHMVTQQPTAPAPEAANISPTPPGRATLKAGNRVRFTRGKKQGTEATVTDVRPDGRLVLQTDEGKVLGGSAGITPDNVELSQKQAPAHPWMVRLPKAKKGGGNVYDDSGLDPKSKYYYKIKAWNQQVDDVASLQEKTDALVSEHLSNPDKFHLAKRTLESQKALHLAKKNLAVMEDAALPEEPQYVTVPPETEELKAATEARRVKLKAKNDAEQAEARRKADIVNRVRQAKLGITSYEKPLDEIPRQLAQEMLDVSKAVDSLPNDEYHKSWIAKGKGLEKIARKRAERAGFVLSETPTAPSPAIPEVQNDQREPTAPVVERPSESNPPGGGLPPEQPVADDAPAAPGTPVPETGDRTEGSGGLPGVPGGADLGGAGPQRETGERGGQPPGGREGAGAGATPAETTGRAGPAGAVGERGRPGRPGPSGGADADAQGVVDFNASLAEEPTPENPTDGAATNWRYPGVDFVQAGLKTKFKANLAAIQALKAIQAEGRTTATAEEQAAMSQFVGWGQFPGLFNHYDRDWAKERASLQSILTDEEWRAASKSTLNAHYTSPTVVQAHWQMAQQLGFKGGRFLETSAGIGYYLGLMPADMAGKTRTTAVELDPITGNLLKQLYPQANVQVSGFQDLASPDGFYDLAASNVPFGDYRVHDPRYNKFQANIHDYFFLKSLDLVRPGGLVMHITSTGTLDKSDSKIRKALFDQADLVAAIRFPGQAHKANAGTDVVTDMLILRKRLPDEAKGSDTWLETTTIPDPGGGEAIPVNAYFAEHPEQVLGTLDRTGTMYRGESVNVTPPADFDAALQAAIARLPKDIYQPALPSKKAFTPEVMPAPGDVKDGGFKVEKGKLFKRDGGSLTEQKASPEMVARINGHLQVRDALRNVLNTQLEGEDANGARTALNKAYDSFVKQHGFLHEAKNQRAFDPDPDAPVVLALENWDKDTKKATKTEVFSKDTIRHTAPVEKAGTVGEAVGVVLNETGSIDLERMATLTGKSKQEIANDLIEQKLAFEDPAEGWKPADQYLSGNVRQKLVLAQAAAQADPRFRPNVTALAAVQPDDVSHDEIEVKLGAGWVPPSDIQDFAAHLLSGERSHFSVQYVPSQGFWLADYTNSGRYSVGQSKTATEVWATPRKGFIDLLEAGLNNKSIQIYNKDADGNSVLDREATDSAAAKVQEIKSAFKDWIWENDARRQRLHRYYNDNFNNIRPIAYNGQHQTFPGMNPGMALRAHQINFVWQVVTTGKGLAAHEVGTGKTFSMVASAMELRRMGLARKPAIVCLKANIEAVVQDALRLYPGAKIITTLDRFDADQRKKTISRIATGDYDMVIMTHDNLDMLQMKPETAERFIKAEIDELEAAKLAAHEANRKKDNRVVKALEKAKARLEARLAEALDPEGKDNAVYFEETGIDHIFVDEAHKYKSLPVYTKQDRVKGIPSARSDRATSMQMRTAWLMERNNGRGVVFATGTPVANTMAELYTMQRYLQPQELQSRGIQAFDAWAAQFGDIQTKMEFTVSGGYKPVSRFSRFVNIPELMQMVRQVMDVRLAKDMPQVVRPKRVDHVIVAPTSSALAGLMRELEQRARNLKQGSDDNMLVICTDGRKGALDMRMIDASNEDDPESKLNKAVNKVLEIHKARPDVTQMIFSDLGVNPTDQGFSVYKDVIAKLVEGGIPRNRIADFSKLEGEKKDAAVQGMREGKILVGIGSTDKMGTGVNAQTKLAALHHLDVPWLPAYIEQRDGRGWRQGNENKQVDIYRYVTEGSLDQTFWQVIASKLAFIKQVIHGEGKERIAKDDADATEAGIEITPEALMAAASGDPRILEKVNLEQDVNVLTKAQQRHDREQGRLRESVASGERDIPRIQARAAAYRADATVLEANPDFAVVIDKKTYTDRKEAVQAFADKVSATDATDVPRPLGTFRGMQIIKKGEQVELVGKATYATGPTLGSVEAVARGIPEQANRAEAVPAKAKEDIERVRAQVGKPFAKASELVEKRARAKEIEGQLKASAAAKEQAAQGTATLEEGETEGEPESFAQPEATAAPSKRIEVAPIPGGTSKKLGDIILDVGKALGRQVVATKTAGGTKGEYFPGTAQARIKYHGDLDATAHELAHAMDDKLGIVAQWAGARQRSPYDAELKPFWEQSSRKSDNLKIKRAEGVAEYLSAWMVNPDQAKAQAPTFHAYLETKIPASVWTAMRTFGDDIRRFAGMSGLEQTAANIRDLGVTGEKTVAERIKEAFTKRDGSVFKVTEIDKAKASVQDKLWAFIKGIRYAANQRGLQTVGQDKAGETLRPLSDPELLLRNYGGVRDVIDQIMEVGPLDTEGKPRLENASANKLLDWADTSSKGSLQRDLKRLKAYMVNQRALDEGAKIDSETARKVDEIRQRFQEQDQTLPDWATSGDAKLMADEIAAVEAEADRRKSHLTGAGGGLRSDIEVAQETIDEVNALPEAERARLEVGAERYREWADATLRHYVDTGMISQERYEATKKANPNYVDMHRVFDDEETIQELKSFVGSARQLDDPIVSLLVTTEVMYRKAARNAVLRGFRDLLVSDRGMYDGKPVSLGDVGQRMGEAGKDTVPIRVQDEEGQVHIEHWQFQPDIKAALDQWGAANMEDGWISKMFQLPARALRYGVTHSPGFIVRNVIRDAFQRAVLSRTGSKPWGVFSKIDKEDVDAYKAGGGGQAGHYLRTKVNYHQEMNKRLGELAKDSNVIVSTPSKVWGWYTKLARGSETVGRMAEFRAAREKAKQKGYSDYEADLYAAYHARSLLDYAISGADVGRFAKYVPFLNAAIQGQAATVNSAMRDPKAFATRWSLYVLMPTIAMYLANMAGDDEDKERYRQLPAWQRDMFWNIPLPGGKWLAIPKPFELGAMASGVERMADAIVTGDTKNLDAKNYASNLVRSLVPVDEGAFAGPFKALLEVAWNRNSFTGQNIIPPYEEKKALELRDTSRASRVAKILQSVLQVDARNVDHLIRSYTGGLGSLAVAAGDIGRSDRNVPIGDLTGIGRNPSGYGMRDVAWSLDESARRGKESTKPVKELRELAKAYNIATGSERLPALRALLKAAKALRKAWEGKPLEEKKK